VDARGPFADPAPRPTYLNEGGTEGSNFRSANTGVCHNASVGRPSAEATTGTPRAERRWHETSLLNNIQHGQTSRNVIGRSRFDGDGRLSSSPDTRLIVSAPDAVGADFLCVEGVMNPRDCESVVAAFEALREFVVKENLSDPYWNDRYLWGHQIALMRPQAAHIMIEAAHNARELLAWFYGLRSPIFNDLFQLVQWKH
jgi:hypothetical protein